MDFISITFLFYYLPAALLVYYILPDGKQKTFLTLASLFFYAWGGTWFLFVTIISLAIDYWLANTSTSSDVDRKKYLYMSIVLNTTPLLYFKLLHINNLEASSWLNYALPIGLSIISLQRISYSIDIYRNKNLHFIKLEDFAFYHLFFPKLITGPLTKLESFGKQIINFKKPNAIDCLYNGGLRFSIGLIKKIIVVSTLSILSNDGFDKISLLGFFDTILIVFTFSLQLFIELSAYADMAIGLALMFGFKLDENFNNPYTSAGIKSFWSNWMQSVYYWFKEYLSPIFKENKNYKNLAIVCSFIVIGIIIGFNPGVYLFIILHSIWMIFENKNQRKFIFRIGVLPSTLVTFLLISLSWILIRLGDLTQINTFIQSILGMGEGSYSLILDKKTIFILSIGSLLTFSPLIPKLKELNLYNLKESKISFIFPLLIGILFIFSIAYLSTETIEPYTFLRF